MSNSNSTSKGTKSMQDQNSVVENGAIVNGAQVTEKRQQAVVLKYSFAGKDCTGVMHVSQFPSLDRASRDKMFAEATIGSIYDGLVAEVEPADKSKGRRFTSVRLSGRSPLEKAAESKRDAARAERQARETALSDAIKAVDGMVVMATVKKLAFAKDPQTKQESDHCFGAFLKTEVGGVEVSGLLHNSRMLGKNRIERLLASYEDGSAIEVVASVTDKGVSFSEEGVKAAKDKAIADERAAKQASEAENFRTIVREALTAGTAEKLAFPAKVTVNRLDAGDGVSCTACGCKVEVSSEDLAIPAKNMRGIGHQLKLVPVSVSEDGTVHAKRYVKA